MDVKIEESWKTQLSSQFEQPYFQQLVQFVRAEYAAGTCYPPGSLIFNAFHATPFDNRFDTIWKRVNGSRHHHEPISVAAIVPIAAAFDTHQVVAMCQRIKVNAAHSATLTVSRAEPEKLRLIISSGTSATRSVNPLIHTQPRLRSAAERSDSSSNFFGVRLFIVVLLCLICATIFTLCKVENLALQ